MRQDALVTPDLLDHGECALGVPADEWDAQPAAKSIKAGRIGIESDARLLHSVMVNISGK